MQLRTVTTFPTCLSQSTSLLPLSVGSGVAVASVSLLRLASSARHWEVVAAAQRLTWVSSRKRRVRNSRSPGSQLGLYVCGGIFSRSSFSWSRGAVSWLGKTAKSLSIFLFFSFSFLLSWTYYIEESVMSQVSHSHGHMTGSHSVTSHDESHDRHGKIVHKPCSSCISSVENLTETLSSFPCQTLIKEQLA